MTATKTQILVNERIVRVEFDLLHYTIADHLTNKKAAAEIIARAFPENGLDEDIFVRFYRDTLYVWATLPDGHPKIYKLAYDLKKCLSSGKVAFRPLF